MQQWSKEDFSRLKGLAVFSQDGEKVGTVQDIYYDDATALAEWIGIGTGFLGTKHILAPLEGVSMANLGADGIRLPYTKELITKAPEIDVGHIDEDTEQRLYSHYRISRPVQRPEAPGRVTPAGPAAAEPRLRRWWAETTPEIIHSELGREPLETYPPDDDEERRRAA